LQAAVIELFQEIKIWNIEALSARLEVKDMTLVRNALYYWANAGALKETPDQEWKLLETADPSEETQAFLMQEPVRIAPMRTVVQSIEDMRAHWPFIKGMITNLQTLSTDQMHSMLVKFLPEYRGKHLYELEKFLDQMQTEGVLQQTATKEWKLA